MKTVNYASYRIYPCNVIRLARIYTESKQFGEVLTLLKSNGDYFATIPKARTAKTVRNILNIVASVPDSLDIQISLCKDVVEWCKLEKRTFLRQRIEAKVIQYSKVPSYVISFHAMRYVLQSC